MLEIKAAPFVEALEALAFARASIAHNGVSFTGKMSAQHRSQSISLVNTIAKAANSLKANNAKREAKFVLEKLEEEGITYEEFRGFLDGLSRLLKGEIAGTKFFVLEPEKSRFFKRAPAVFGVQSVASFPKAEYDLEEAGKCFAAARNTACVFHLMRAMEIALQALCGNLGLEKVDKRWGFLLADIDGKLKGMPDGDLRSSWSLARSSLWHVKEAWRNETMHPSDKYTDEEAKDVLEATRAFLKSLSALTT